MGSAMRTDVHSLSLWEREGARSAQPRGKGEGDRNMASVTLTLPPLRGSLPLPMGEGL
jgi:hypothetical protein